MPSKWIPIVPIPEDARHSRPVAHTVRGKPEHTFDFYDDRGLVGYVCRFTGSDGTPRDLPLCFCIEDDGTDTPKMEWRWQSFGTPRPLYGASRLVLAKPETVVVVTDDPAAVDAGYKLMPGFAYVAYLGGLTGLKKAEWKPLANRKVVLWPSADAELADDQVTPLPRAEQPLMRAAKQLSTQLVRMGCEVKILEPPEPGRLAANWNLDAAFAESWNPTDLLAWMEERCKTVFSRNAFGFKGTSTPSRASANPSDNWRREARMILRRGELADCRENVIEILAKHPAWAGVLAWDEFSYKIVKRREPPFGGKLGEWTEHEDVALGQWLAHEEGLVIRSTETIGKAVAFVSEANRIHPVREYLESLEWDGVDRLEQWLQDCFGVTDTPYARIAGPIILMNLVARVFEPGCIMRVVPVLVGPQMRGKSTALGILGGEWFADTMFNVGAVDAYQVLRGKWLYEISEFHSFGRAEATRVKAFVSSRQDTYRASYGRNAKDWLRQVCFFASTNQYEIFRDPTGSTRFWPIETNKEGEINLEAVRANRDQLFAEAVMRVKRGDRRYPTAEQERDHFQPVQERHEVQHPWYQPIRDYVEKRWASGRKQVTHNEILADVLGIELSKVSATTSETLTVVSILQKLGCTKDRESVGARKYFYEIPDSILSTPVASDYMKAKDDDAPF